MISLPEIFGEVRPVPLVDYERIIHHYVEKVRQLSQVVSIIQMGSFSTPGLSDIDIIVVLDEMQPFPKWGEISLKTICKDLPSTEVIAHDIFVIPQAVADNAEAYFYIDQQTVLYGKPIGGILDKEMIERCKLLLAMDYAIFNLESITGILLAKRLEIRRLALLISTMRHSLTLTNKYQLIDSRFQVALLDQIDSFRSSTIKNQYDIGEIKVLLTNFVNLLGQTISHIGNKEMQFSRQAKPSLRKNSKAIFKGVDCNANTASPFFSLLNRQQRSPFSKAFKVIPVPPVALSHILAYFYHDKHSFQTLYPFLKKKELIEDQIKENQLARNVRRTTALVHWSFLKQANYAQSSGVAYLGLYRPEFKDKKYLFKLYFSRLYFAQF